MITQKINKNYLQFHCNILINYFTNNKDEFKILNNKSIKEHLLFILLSTIIDYIYNAPGVCKNRNQFNTYQVFLDDQNLEKPFVLILEGLLTLTICTDIVLKVITEGLVFFTAAWNILDLSAFLSIIACIRMQQEVYYDELFGISLISMRYLSLTVRLVVLLKQSYAIQMMQQQRDILIYKKSRNQDLSILDISSEILNDSQFVETMKLVSD